MIEFIQKQYYAYYLITVKDASLYNRFEVAYNLLDVLSQTYNFSVIEDSNKFDSNDAEEIVYDAIDLFATNGGLIITFLPEYLVESIMKVYNIYKAQIQYGGNIHFAYYGDLDFESMSNDDYAGHYMIVHYNPHNSSKENIAFKTLLGDSFKGSEYKYSDVLSYSIFQLWKGLIKSTSELSINAITSQMKSVSVNTPLGIISVDESQHLQQSIYIIQISKEYNDSLVTHISQNISGNPFFTTFNTKSVTLCDLFTRNTDNYKPNLYYIGIALPLDAKSTSNSMYILRGVLSGIGYVNSKISKSMDFYIVPYILKDENDEISFLESVEKFGELVNGNNINIKGGIIIGGGTSYLFFLPNNYIFLIFVLLIV